MMLTLLVVVGFAAAPPAPPDRAGEAPAVVAGATAAGFVGGALFAVPAVIALLPTTGPFIAFPVGILLVAGGASFGGFLGELSYAHLGPAGMVSAIGGGGALVGALLGGLAGAGLASAGDRSSGGGGGLFGGFVGAAVGGLVGAAGAGALGAAWLTPDDR